MSLMYVRAERAQDLLVAAIYFETMSELNFQVCVTFTCHKSLLFSRLARTSKTSGPYAERKKEDSVCYWLQLKRRRRWVKLRFWRV